MRVVKILSVLVAVLLITALVVVANIDPNRFKPEIEAQLASVIGHPVSLDGEVTLELFPPLSLAVDSGHISNPPGFPAGKMFSFKKVSVGVDLIAFLSGEIKVEQLFLLGAEIHILENSADKLNWSIFTDAKTSPTSQGGTDATQTSKPWADSLSVAGITLKESRILWLDAEGRAVVDFSKLDFETGRFEVGMPVDLGLTGDFHSDVYPFTGNVSLEAEVLLAKNNEQLEIKNLVITGEGTGQSPDGEPFSLKEMKVRGEISANLSSQKIAIRTLDASVVVKNTGLLPLALSASGTADLKAESLVLGTINGAVGKARFKGDLNVVALKTKPKGNFSLQTGSFNPRELARALGLNLPSELPEQALKKAKLDAKLSFDTNGLTVREANISLDNTHLTGQGRFNWKPARDLKGKIKLDHMVLDDYLPAPDEEDEEEKKNPVLLSDIFQFPVSLTLDAGKLLYETAEINDVHARITANRKMFYLQDFQANAFDGELKAEGLLNTGARASRTKGSLKNVELQEALKIFLGKKAWLSRLKGYLNSNWQLSAKGTEATQMLKTLGGEADVLLQNATFLDEKFVQKLETIVVALNQGKSVTENLEVIHSLVGAVTFVDGVGTISRLKGDMALFVINGRGKIDLRRNLLDLRISLQPKKLLQFDEIIPVRIRGDLDDPTYSLDIGDILKRKAQKKVQEAIQEKIREKIQDGGSKKIQDFLKEQLNF